MERRQRQVLLFTAFHDTAGLGGGNLHHLFVSSQQVRRSAGRATVKMSAEKHHLLQPFVVVEVMPFHLREKQSEYRVMTFQPTCKKRRLAGVMKPLQKFEV